MERHTLPDPAVAEELSYLEGLQGLGIRTDLGPTRTALALLDNPERSVPSVIVGGTNGKGSTVSMVGNIIRHAEYIVGCYYSPHIRDVTERIVLNGQAISRKDMARLIARVRDAVAGTIELTYFEFLTVSAYRWFADMGADLSVIEVGMGGRFDATNVADPLVSIITTVELDHTRYLGSTEEAIAAEKVRIVPAGGTLVAGRVSAGVARVLSDYAVEVNAEVVFLGRDFEGVPVAPSEGVSGGTMRYRGLSASLDDIRLPLAGGHQADNATVALAAVEVLSRKGFSIPERAVREGIESIRLPGRIQRLSEAPEVIVDVAHNPAGGRALADFIETEPKKRTAVVVGMMADKDIAGFMREIARVCDILVVASPRVGRAAPNSVLTEAAGLTGKRVHPEKGVGEAVDWARSAVGSGGRVVITGSFYTVQEAMEWIGAAGGGC